MSTASCVHRRRKPRVRFAYTGYALFAVGRCSCLCFSRQAGNASTPRCNACCPEVKEEASSSAGAGDEAGGHGGRQALQRGASPSIPAECCCRVAARRIEQGVCSSCSPEGRRPHPGCACIPRAADVHGVMRASKKKAPGALRLPGLRATGYGLRATGYALCSRCSCLCSPQKAGNTSTLRCNACCPEVKEEASFPAERGTKPGDMEGDRRCSAAPRHASGQVLLQRCGTSTERGAWRATGIASQRLAIHPATRCCSVCGTLHAARGLRQHNRDCGAALRPASVTRLRPAHPGALRLPGLRVPRIAHHHP